MTGEEFLTPESVEPLRRALSASAGRFVVPDPAASPGEGLTVPIPSRLRLAAMLDEVVPTAAAEASLTLWKVRVVDRGRETVRWRFDAPAQVLRSGGRTGMVSRATPEMEALAAAAVDLAAAEVLRRGRARGLVDAASDSLIEQRERRALDWLREVGRPRPPASDVTAADLGFAGVLPDGVGLDVEALFRSAGIPTGRGRAQAPSDAAVVERIRAALPFDVSITMTREPFDDVRRVTLERAERRAISWQELAAVRRTLREIAPQGVVFVVRDAASLRGPRERATAPLPEGAIEPVTAETIRARLERAFKRPYPSLP